jgi:hypothetical protein
VEEAASVACYDPIPPDQLRVWVEDAPKDRPDQWPPIKVVEHPGKWSGLWEKS